LARSDRTRSWRLCQQALKSDYTDIQGGTTPEGIHLGAMAGSVDIIQNGYSGIEPRGDMLRFNPCLPEELERLAMEIRYRGHTLNVEITQQRLKVSSCPCMEQPIKILFNEGTYELKAGRSQTFDVVCGKQGRSMYERSERSVKKNRNEKHPG
ncbi:MAG: glycosyl hydrolase family 65 protein, partial [Desulfobacteraceae bacterium]